MPASETRPLPSAAASAYRSLFDLDGTVAVVTGGAGIIGTEACRGLAAHGAAVAVLDVNAAAAEALAERLEEESGGAAVGIGCDVRDREQVEAAVERVVRRWGRIDVLHNNAASKSADLERFFAATEDYALEPWREVMAVNVDGLFLVAQAVGRRMIEQGTGGSIIQTASIYGLGGPDERIYEGADYDGHAINTPAVYSASKGAVVALTRHLATTWAQHDIRVNALTPGGVESGQNNAFRQRYGARVPLGRMARREEMVGAIVFLAAPASSYVTGHNLVVDGGWTAW